MIVNGTEANTLLAAQLASQQRQPSQEAAAQAQRDQSLQVQEASTRRGASEAPLSATAVRAVETDEPGRVNAARREPPRDAQADARNVLDAGSADGGDRPLQRGAVVNLLA
jgi:hypothetical protein